MEIRYWGAVVIAAEQPLHVIADELNAFLSPLRLVETERFDEVPGYVAVATGLEFSLQGQPDDVESDGHYYFDFVCEPKGVGALPSSMSDLAQATGPESGPEANRQASKFLQARLSANTTLVCKAD